MKTDVIIIADSRSFAEDNELRFTIRSICKYICELGKLIVVGRNPSFGKDIVFIPFAKNPSLNESEIFEAKRNRAIEVCGLEGNIITVANGQIHLGPKDDFFFLTKSNITPDVMYELKKIFPDKSNFELTDMKETAIESIKKYLESPKKDYQKGLALFIDHGKNHALKRTLMIKGETPYSREKLEYELGKLIDFNKKEADPDAAINKLKARQKKEEKKTEPVKEKQIVVVDPMKRSIETTNSLLKKDWPSLTGLEQEYFGGSAAEFAKKAAMFKGNADLYEETRALHAKMRQLPEGSDEERKDLLAQIEVNEQTLDEVWSKIDDFSFLEASGKSDVDVALENEKHIRNIKTSISKTKGKLKKDPDHAKAEEWKEKIVELEKELEQLTKVD